MLRRSTNSKAATRAKANSTSHGHRNAAPIDKFQGRDGCARPYSQSAHFNAAPIDKFQGRDGRFVCIVAVRQVGFERLCEAMDRPDLLDDECFPTPKAPRRNREVVNQAVAEWASGLDATTIEDRCGRHGVPVSVVYGVADMAADDHVHSRGDVCTVDDPVIGPVRQQAPFPRFDGDSPPVSAGAPRFGEHTDEVLSSLLGLTGTQIETLREKHVR